MTLYLVSHQNRDGRPFLGVMEGTDYRLASDFGYINLGEVKKGGKAFRQENGHMATPFVHSSTGRVYARFVDWSAREITLSEKAA